MKLQKIEIETFRHLTNVNFSFGKHLTIIAGSNGTGKTSVLGLIGHVFKYPSKFKTVIGTQLSTKFSEVFRFSPAKDYQSVYKYKIYFLDGTYRPGESRLTQDRYRIDVGGRVRGGGKIKCPVIYLSLKRLMPLADESWITMGSLDQLTAAQKEKYKSIYNEIFASSTAISPLHTVSNNKNSYSPVTSSYDAYGISAGQDNIGQLILALLEFRRLKENFPDYSGGVLLVDELDATLYPASQKNLLRVMLSEARDLSLQIIFTTHSSDILNHVNSRSGSYLKHDTNFVGLSNATGAVVVKEGYSALQAILADINHEAIRNLAPRKINVYFEDNEACIFYRNILKYFNLSLQLEFKPISLSSGTYKTLIENGFEELFKSIVVLDGDYRTAMTNTRSGNVIFLPGNVRPENVIRDFLLNLSDSDEFWTNENQYTKRVFLQNLHDVKDNRESMKRWFNAQAEFWGNDCERLFNRWKADNLQDCISIRLETRRLVNKILDEYHTFIV